MYILFDKISVYSKIYIIRFVYYKVKGEGGWLGERVRRIVIVVIEIIKIHIDHIVIID